MGAPRAVRGLAAAPTGSAETDVASSSLASRARFGRAVGVASAADSAAGSDAGVASIAISATEKKSCAMNSESTKTRAVGIKGLESSRSLILKISTEMSVLSAATAILPRNRNESPITFTAATRMRLPPMMLTPLPAAWQ